MSYHLDFNTLDLDFLKHRLMTEDLIPSHLPLRDGLDDRLARISSAGIKTLADLDEVLKKDTSLKKLADTSGIPAGDLKLLARVINGYRPKPAPLHEYPGVSERTVSALALRGIRDSRSLWDATCTEKILSCLAADINVPVEELRELAGLADLSRIQWVSPLFARLLHAAGFGSVSAVAAARAEDLTERVAEANRKKNLFKGKIGQRDIGRLVYLAGLLVKY